MGNMLKVVQDFGQTMIRPMGVQTWKSELDMVQEDLLVQELSELTKVELWRVHWCLSQDLLQNFPPVPPHWLWSADPSSTAKTMLRCYNEEGALVMLAKVLTVIGRDDLACHLHNTTVPLSPRTPPKHDPDFVKHQRSRLISRMQCPDTILIALEDYGILNTANREVVSIYRVRRDKTRALVDLVLKKGDEAHEVFYQALSQSEAFLMQELEDSSIRDENSSDILDVLVSDELKSLQWLVSDHMTKESQPPIGGEQLDDTEGLLGKHFGPKQATVALNILLKIVPALSVYLGENAVTSQTTSDIRVDTDTAQVDITPEVHEDGNMFRLRCQQPGVFRCSLTGLLLEGFGDVVYQTVPWDVDFLSSKGLRPAGPLIRFTLLAGRFHRLHLPHCQLLSGGSHLSVAHVTDDHVDLIKPALVTDGHVIINISGFSCLGVLAPAPSNGAISGLVLLFFQPTDSSLFVLLLPRNVSITEVIAEWKRRNGAIYVEVIPDCELVPNQTYRLNGPPGTDIQPERSKFMNFADYNNFLPSFQVQLPPNVTCVELQLIYHVTPFPLIGWLLRSTECVVWSQVVQLRAAVCRLCPEVCVSESVNVTMLLLDLLNSLTAEDLKTFQHFLSLWSDPIPVSRLESADRTRTVDLMVQQYHAEGAKAVTEEILRRMNKNQLADRLMRNS
ncbi:uncharacterized protein LOC113139863 [Mastacembelus armatus]|uniref:uncharacterized protein LOC113139863 n=1 Tax=Mastacembelus armatus TaxID=205130 RepID=UPI000E45C56B|nr:uncharacterized protein LOC113139863 [Mastacembelus armatus]XP_026179252.1 uncharacterized protein LOC113139863 [Mastacembelus armatus]